MKKKLQKRKAFTIVELVIVIAVIGILSAVLIPTFGRLINKAKMSSDNQMIHNLNIALAMSESVNDNSNKPFHSVLESLEDENGLSKNSIKATSSGDVLYDSVNNRFLLTDENGNVVVWDKSKTETAPNVKENSYLYWKIYDNKDVKLESNPVYSIYWNTTDNFELSTISVGFDAGDNTGITNLTYKNNDNYSKNITIRTNGGSLVIDGYVDGFGDGDNVSHYGIADSVEVIKVGNNSYHEYGVSLETTINSGRFVAEANSKTVMLNIEENVTVSPVVKANSKVMLANNKSTNLIHNSSSNEIVEVLSKEEQSECLHTFELVEGFSEKICNKCGLVLDSNHKHEYSKSVLVDATTHKKECTICRESAIENHSEDVEVGFDSTCKINGKTDKIYCADCGYVMQEHEDLPLAEHKYLEEFAIDIPATCKMEGSKSRHCENCEATTDETPVAKAEHKYSEEFTVDIPATCKMEGSKSRHCKNCEATTDETLVAKAEHKYSEEFTIDIPATCKMEGSKSRHCENCEATTDETPISKTEHNFVSGACDVCGFTEMEEFLELLSSISDDNNIVTLNKDYDFNGANWNLTLDLASLITSEDTVITIDGNNHVIKNLNSEAESAGLFGNVNVNLVIKNLIIDNTAIDGGLIKNTSEEKTTGAGAFVGAITAGNLELDNCHAVNVNIESEDYAGGLVGLVKVNTTITNSSVESVTLKALYCGGILGAARENTETTKKVNIDNCVINKITVKAKSSQYSGGVVGLIYSRKFDVTINSISGSNNSLSSTRSGVIAGSVNANSSCKVSNSNSFIDGKKLAGEGSVQKV